MGNLPSPDMNMLSESIHASLERLDLLLIGNNKS